MPHAFPLLSPRHGRRLLLLTAATLMLQGCGDSGFDWDMRPSNAGSTADAARQVAAPRPEPDSRGVISYPGYQVVVARSGDRVADVAARLDIDAQDLARRNAVDPDTRLREGEVLTLPARVDAAPGARDVDAIASTALDRVDGNGSGPPAAARGSEPLQHTVTRGETAFTIARLYNVTPRALADWNGLGSDMAVREGQVLMIPVAQPEPERTAAAAPPPAPGSGSPTPTPPSATRPLPQDDTASDPPPDAPPSPSMAEDRSPPPTQDTDSATTRLAMPLQGRIIREFQPGRTDGISIAADAGSPVRAAAAGTVATITRDTGGTQIVILRHEGNLLTVYANIDEIAVERGQNVSRGTRLGALQAGDQPFLLFQVREGIESVDPMRFLD